MLDRILLVLFTALATLGVYATFVPRAPDPGLIDLAVRSTVFALPKATPQVIEIVVEATRVVEVTRLVEVVRVVEAVSSPIPPPPTPSPSPRPIAAPAVVPPIIQAARSVPPENPPTSQLCGSASTREYVLVPVLGPGASHPDAQHGDLNLGLRGYVNTEGPHALVDINGPTDGDAPQLAGIFAGNGPQIITALHRVHDWNWACGERGCRGNLLDHVAVSAMSIALEPGGPVYLPTRGPEIYGGGYIALVLYAEPTRLTVVYTRDDSVANGYAVHLENLCVDASLVARYRAANAAGRGSLPAIRNGDVVGTALSTALTVAIRDRGSFKDPRSRKDWWQGY